MHRTMDGWRPAYWRIGAWGLVAALLLVPLVAMQFTSAVNWGVGDFLAAAVLLVGVGLAIELAWRLVQRKGPRLALGLAIVATGALIWAELAVGLFS